MLIGFIATIVLFNYVLFCQCQTFYDFHFESIDGHLISFDHYKSARVILVVNVAPQCSTSFSNFKKLNFLYQTYNTSGLEILGNNAVVAFV